MVRFGRAREPMNPRTLLVFRLSAIVAGVLVLALWWGRRPPVPIIEARREVPPVMSRPDSSGAVTRRPAPVADPRGLLAGLQALLDRTGVRARETVLTFKDEAGLQRFLDRANGSQLEVLGQLSGLRSVRVRHRSFSALEAELIAHAGDYDAISANYTLGVPSVPVRENRAAVDQVPFGNQALGFLGVDTRRQENASWGRGVTIAILDTGVAGDPTLAGGRLSALDIGLGTTPGTGRDAGHGTAVAALAAGSSADAPGVAPGANLLSIRVTDANGASDLFTLAQAIATAADAGARIINVSLGGHATTPLLDAAIDYAMDRGAVIVAAAGNDQAAALAWPAADPRVISVGAVDAIAQQVMFSNSGAQLQLTAPGYGVQTAWLDGARALVDGTSASAPLVAGAIAAVMSQNPGLTAQAAAQIVTQTASDAGVPGSDPAYGHGILNLDWAMNYQRTGYFDTAIATHFHDAAHRQIQVVIQNRGGQAVTGLTLNVAGGATDTNLTLPSLMPGESYVAKVPVNEQALKGAGSLLYTTRLVNPPGVADAVPDNNERRSVVIAP